MLGYEMHLDDGDDRISAVYVWLLLLSRTPLSAPRMILFL
jgi:hypothetical protein